MNKRTQPESEPFVYTGFGLPESNYFRMPKEWTDITCHLNSLAEIKVVEYILKHTWGYHEYGLKKQITTDEFIHGRRRKDGSRMDQGTGLSAPSVRSGLKSAVAHGLVEEEVDARDRARIKKQYALRLRNREVEQQGKHLSSDGKRFTPDRKDSSPRGSNSYHRSEKETTERNTVNGNVIQTLPNLKQPEEKTVFVAQIILDQLGDDHSLRFYRLVAAKVPEGEIRRALAEVKADGAREPARLFTHKMKLYALNKRKVSIA